MDLSNLKYAEGSTRNRKRIGRGQGSGHGGTSTRGHKGAKSRSGYTQKIGFEGGQMPLQRRVPKFGFKNFARVEYKPINLETLQIIAEKENINVIDIDYFINNGFANKKSKIKILGQGSLSLKLEVRAHNFSKSAIKIIESLGGMAIKI